MDWRRELENWATTSESCVAAGEAWWEIVWDRRKKRPSRQLEVPEKGFGEVIKLISSPTHSPGGTGLALHCCSQSAEKLLHITTVCTTLYHIRCPGFSVLLFLHQPFRALHIHTPYNYGCKQRGVQNLRTELVIVWSWAHCYNWNKDKSWLIIAVVGHPFPIYMKWWNIFNNARLLSLDLVWKAL